MHTKQEPGDSKGIVQGGDSPAGSDVAFDASLAEYFVEQLDRKAEKYKIPEDRLKDIMNEFGPSPGKK